MLEGADLVTWQLARCRSSMPQFVLFMMICTAYSSAQHCVRLTRRPRRLRPGGPPRSSPDRQVAGHDRHKRLIRRPEGPTLIGSDAITTSTTSQAGGVTHG